MYEEMHTLIDGGQFALRISNLELKIQFVDNISESHHYLSSLYKNAIEIKDAHCKLIGISYNTKTKQHECMIETYK